MQDIPEYVSLYDAYRKLHEAYPRVTSNTIKVLAKSGELRICRDLFQKEAVVSMEDVRRVLRSWGAQSQEAAQEQALTRTRQANQFRR